MARSQKAVVALNREVPRVSDLFKDGEWINLLIDVGDSTIYLTFREETFEKFRESINRRVHKL